MGSPAPDPRSAPPVTPGAGGAEAPPRHGGGRVVVTWIDYDPENPATGGRLRDAGLTVELAPKHGARSAEEVAELMRDAVAAIVSTDPFDRSVLAAARRLRVIARVGVGTDSIDLRAATEAGVAVTTTPGANRETTADHALAMILAALRRIVEHDAAVRRGEWARAGASTGWDLHGTTVGLLGCGAIGRAVARRLSGFDARVLVADPALTGSPDADVVPLERLLAEVDVLSLHLPLLGTTRGIIGAAELDRMRPEAILVNTARGGLVDEAALVDALANGRLRGAALDVFADEPRVPEPLRLLPNVILTPHVGGLSERSIGRMTEHATSSVLEVLSGAASTGAVVNPRALAHHRHHAATATTQGRS